MSAGATIRAANDQAPVTLGVGLAVSLLLHAGAALWLGFAPARAAAFPASKIEADVERLPDPLRLGMDIPRNASIAWLGVLENPVEAAAPESEVDQAELSPVPGAVPVPEVSPPEVVEAVEEPVEEPLEIMPPVAPVVVPPAAEEPVGGPVIEPEPEPEPPVEPAAEPDPAPPELVTEQPIAPTVPPEMNEPNPAEPVEATEAGVMGPPEPTPEERVSEARAEARPVQPTPRPPTPEGAPGELDERASDAAMRRTARELPVERLGRPLQASGELQLTTVRPVWSLQVRNAYSPRRNPFIEIRFGGDGRVRWARFVPLADGTEGSGYEEVDQPLLNAVFRWRASGPAIEALRGREPGATHDIVMRFLLVSPVPGERDEE